MNKGMPGIHEHLYKIHKDIHRAESDEELAKIIIKELSNIFNLKDIGIFIRGKLYTKISTISVLETACHDLFTILSNKDPESSGFETVIHDFEQTHLVMCFPLSTLTESYGFLIIKEKSISDIGPLIENILDVSALVIENRHNNYMSKQLYHDLVETSQDLIWQCDINGCYIYLNKAWENVFGYKLCDMLGKKFTDFQSPDVADRDIREFQRLIKGNTIAHYETIHLGKNGNPIHLVFNAKYVSDVNGKITGTRGTAYDITERKTMEEILRNQREFLMMFLETIPNPVYYKDSSLKYIACNKAFEEFIGKNRTEIIGKSACDITPKDLADIYRQKDEDLMVKPGKQMFECEVKIIDGPVRHVIFNKATMTDSRGQVIGIIGVISDITERKKAEDEKDSLQNQLLQAHKIESIGRLAGGVAHDFNNMIMVIMGNAELALSESSPSQPDYDYLQEILRSAKKSAELTQQLLAFARKQTISTKKIQLNDLIPGMIRMLQRLIGENINLIFKPGPALWNVKMDPTQVNQILANLAVNARDAITGTGKLTIETRNISMDAEYCMQNDGCSPGDYVMIAVSDTGSGLTKENMAHLFEPFYTTKEIGKGTGLGLATIHGIVRQNSGFINVYSEHGKGTTFKIYIPRFESEETKVTKIPEKKPSQGSETVLLVEDEPAILILGKTILSRLGYTVLSAQTPYEALTLADVHKSSISLLITDIIMPQMNGNDLFEKIRIKIPEIRCLFMSGYTEDIIAHQGILEEGIHFLQKPFSVKTLASKAREVLDQ